jgi:glycosyltransferase involved in cell wall biosynthesis
MGRGSVVSRLQAGFVMEQVLGHISHYDTLRRVVERDENDIDPRWIEVTYRGNGRLEGMSKLPASVRGTMRGFLQVREGLRRGPLDAVLFHTQKPAVFQWDLLMRTPSVLSLDVTPRQYDELGEFYEHAADGDTPVAHLKHWINVRTFALAKKIVVWSQWVKDSLVADYGVLPDKVRVIPPGVDLNVWTAQPERSDDQPPGQLPRILFVGGDFERKGGSLLLDWYRQHGRGRCELDIVTRAGIQHEPGVHVHTNIVGNSPAARRMFGAADVFVLPSLGECFGIASVEAMAASLPVVATAVGGAGDIVDHGTTGFLIQPNSSRDLSEALDRLIGDRELRRDMGRAGRRKAERAFDGAANADALIDCLKQVA